MYDIQPTRQAELWDDWQIDITDNIWLYTTENDDRINASAITDGLGQNNKQ